MWWFNSSGDFDNHISYDFVDQFGGGGDYGIQTGGSAQFNTMQSIGNWFRYTYYSGIGAPGHVGTWDSAIGNGIPGGAMLCTDPMWAWLLSQQSRSRRRYGIVIPSSHGIYT